MELGVDGQTQTDSRPSRVPSQRLVSMAPRSMHNVFTTLDGWMLLANTAAAADDSLE